MTRVIVVALAVLSSASAAQPVPVRLSEWKLWAARDTVTAGPVTFRVSNEGSMNHALYVRGEGVDKGTKEITARQSASLTVTLKPGTYELFCPMSDESHKMAGMSKTLVVKAAPTSTPPPAKP
jgi:plastocyanin